MVTSGENQIAENCLDLRGDRKRADDFSGIARYPSASCCKQEQIMTKNSSDCKSAGYAFAGSNPALPTLFIVRNIRKVSVRKGG